MTWIAPTEKDTLSVTLEKRQWDSADQFRANSGLKAQEYSGPILDIIFLRFAEVRFAGHSCSIPTQALQRPGRILRRFNRFVLPERRHT
jgi:type I restriction enzyme M protein